MSSFWPYHKLCNFPEISDAISWIVEAKTGQENLNYLDDYFFADILTSLCNQQIGIFKQICCQIGMPVSEDKTFLATDRLPFLGLLIDVRNQMVCVPMDKVAKIVNIIKAALNRESKKTTLFELQVIAGHLNFIGRCVVPGRAFTRRFYSAMCHGVTTRNPKGAHFYVP